MKFLIDHNIRGQAQLLLKVIENEGWLNFVAIRFVTFEEMALAIDSSDRAVWRLAQANHMTHIPHFKMYYLPFQEKFLIMVKKLSINT